MLFPIVEAAAQAQAAGKGEVFATAAAEAESIGKCCSACKAPAPQAASLAPNQPASPPAAPKPNNVVPTQANGAASGSPAPETPTPTPVPTPTTAPTTTPAPTPAPVDTTSPDQVQDALTCNCDRAPATATAISQAIAAAGGGCDNKAAQALARKFAKVLPCSTWYCRLFMTAGVCLLLHSKTLLPVPNSGTDCTKLCMYPRTVCDAPLLALQRPSHLPKLLAMPKPSLRPLHRLVHPMRSSACLLHHPAHLPAQARHQAPLLALLPHHHPLPPQHQMVGLWAHSPRLRLTPPTPRSCRRI